MGMIDRVKAIILSPKAEWPVIEAETQDVASIYKNYLIYLAAIGPLALFISMSVFGMSFGGITVRTGFFSGLVQALVTFALTLVMFYVIALIVDALAPKFGGQKNMNNAFKLVAYGSTASLVAAVLYLFPMLSILVLLASFYALYTIYIGLPVMMKNPPEKTLPYMAVLVVCGFVAGLLMAMLSSCFGGPSGRMDKTGDAGGGSISIKTPSGEITIDSKKIQEASKKLEAAGKKLEAATQPGDASKTADASKTGKPANPADAGKAVAEALGALAGLAGGREPIAAASLKEMLPEVLGDLKRESFETKDGSAMGIKGSMAEAVYRAGERRVEIKIADTGGLAGLMALAGWVNVTGEKDNSSISEKVYKQGNRTVREQVSKGSNDVEYSLVLANGVMIEVEGAGMSLAAARKIAESLPLAKLEAIGAK